MNGAFGFGGAKHPLQQAASLLVFAVLLVGAVALGTVIFVAVVGVAAVVFAVFAARVWWLQRKLRAAGAERARQAPPADGRLIEAEYTVIEPSKPEAHDDRDGDGDGRVER
jgi:membrane protein implicated in regulation of membrane protease activity